MLHRDHALLFPAISLIMLAYTNRFLTLATIIRNFSKEERDDNTQAQIKNLRLRIQLIKRMQIAGVGSFFLCVVSFRPGLQPSDLKKLVTWSHCNTLQISMSAPFSFFSRRPPPHPLVSAVIKISMSKSRSAYFTYINNEQYS